ncbi:unnamed protein product [Rodentolepis nana]|uniref:BSD domain-containing protein n=1 Tax=Rodentolepis nana TaxID=102285 RepID=A0A0R3TCI3_RODNA|nr:unnamed protein product [Rodentolepis nana]
MICTDENPQSATYATSMFTSGQSLPEATFQEDLIDEEFKRQLYDIFVHHLSTSTNPQDHVISNPLAKIPSSFDNLPFESIIEITGWFAFFLVYVPRALKEGGLTYLQRTKINVEDKSLDEFTASLNNRYSNSLANDPFFQPFYKEWETYFHSL